MQTDGRTERYGKIMDAFFNFKKSRKDGAIFFIGNNWERDGHDVF
jgi:hypothetical protein